MAHIPTLTIGPRDGCPNCVGRTAVRPWSVRNNRAAVICHYRCPRCAHRWYTTWDRRALGTGRTGKL